MAREVVVRLVDDLDGGEATETVQLSLNGRAVELDLSEKNVTALRHALDRFLDAGRPVAAATSRRSSAAKQASRGRDDVAQVRTWLRENGHQVPDRGRLKPEMYAIFDAAHPATV